MTAWIPRAALRALARRPVSARAHRAALAATLLLSAYVHLWNPVGFPDIFFDEGVYMRRAMHLAETGSPQESYLYDHPYFGQIVLAGFLKAAGFPETAAESAEAPYLAPRVLMGLLAVLDTFLVYRIAGARLGRRAAIIAAVLFAAMPMTWMLRRIVLDGLALPLVLSSILLALHAGGGGSPRRGGALLACSAVLLGLAAFTKLTAVSMLPVVAYLAVSARGWRALPPWLALAAAVPAAWPAAALHASQARLWLDGVLWQAGRQAGAAGERLAAATAANLAADPLLMGLGLAGAAYAAARRRLFLVLWIAPFVPLAAVTYFQYFHYILVLPAMCASAAFMIDDVISRRIARPHAQRAAAAASAVLLAAAGAAWSGALVSEDLSSAQLAAASHLASGPYGNTTILASPVYSWVLSDVHGMPHVAPDYSHVLFYPVETDRYVIVADSHLLHDLGRGERLAGAYARSAAVWEGAGPHPGCAGAAGGSDSDWPARGPCAGAMHLAAPEGSLVQVRIGHAGPLAGPPG